ncbi:LOW QUALITY PROTEIN: protein SSUH2 homolog [Amazona ochrocephala]
MPPMTEAVATSLLHFLSLRCCYGSRAAGELAIRCLRQAGTYYRLETFSEPRLSERVFEPFATVPGVGQHPCTTSSKVDKTLSPPEEPRAAGSPVDAPMDLWDMEAGPPLLFQGWTLWCWVPHSALVTDCHRCHGHGRSKCRVCHGTGQTRCVTCKGSQRRLKQQKRCELCSGTGHKRFEVYPIIDFPGPEISLASQRAIAEHNAVLAVSSRILWQHQPIELIPITEVHYQHSGKPYVYYIYGLKSKVYALDYPERCCCSCTII